MDRQTGSEEIRLKNKKRTTREVAAVQVRSGLKAIYSLTAGNKNAKSCEIRGTNMSVIKTTAIEAGPRYNEAEVRFHIVDPIMRKLGYPDNENVYLNLEEKLEYPYVHIGRRSKKDVPLGFPDYRAGLKGARGSFVVEAKAGGVPITNLEVEQAHSYAAHAQVGANYFILCNGYEITVYETLSGSSASPLARIALVEINDRFHELDNILSPESLGKNCKIVYDTKLKLCDGMASSVQISGGEYKVSENSYKISINGNDCTEAMRANVPLVSEIDSQLELLKTAFELRVVEGTAERGEDGRISANIRFGGVTIHNTTAMQIMGIERAAFVTADQFLSRDESKPSMFESLTDFSVSKGAMMPKLFGGFSEVESTVTGDMFIRAGMFFDGEGIQGQYLAVANYVVEFPVVGIMMVELSLSGTFALRINL